MVRARTFVAAALSLLLFSLMSWAVQADDKYFVDMSVTQTDSPDPVLENGFVVYSVVVRNAGPDPANGIVVNLSLSAGTFVSGSGHRWSCSTNSTTALCTHSGALPAGNASDILSVTVQAPPSGTANKITHGAVVSSSYTDTNLLNNTSSETTNITPGSDLTLTLTEGGEPNPVTAGNTVRYLVNVMNNANSINATGVKLTSQISAGQITSVSGGDSWTCTENTTTSSCELSGDIPPNSTAPIVEVLVLTPFSASGFTLFHTAKVSSTSPDPNQNNNTQTEETEVVPSGQGSATGYISPDGGQVTTCTPVGTDANDTTCATVIFPAGGPGGIASLIEGMQLSVCEQVRCAGNSVDVIVPVGYDPGVTAPISVVIRVDFSVAPNVANDATREVWVQKSEPLQTVVIPSCETRIPGQPCLDGFEREGGTSPDLFASIEMFSGDPIFNIGDGSLG